VKEQECEAWSLDWHRRHCIQLQTALWTEISWHAERWTVWFNLSDRNPKYLRIMQKHSERRSVKQ